MNASWYIKKYKWLKARPTLSKAIITLCHILSDAIYLAYIVSVGLLFIKHDARIWAFIGVPAIGFLTETLLRAKLNWPRPYEVLPFLPSNQKIQKAKAFLVAMLLVQLSYPLLFIPFIQSWELVYYSLQY